MLHVLLAAASRQVRIFVANTLVICTMGDRCSDLSMSASAGMAHMQEQFMRTWYHATTPGSTEQRALQKIVTWLRQEVRAVQTMYLNAGQPFRWP